MSVEKDGDGFRYDTPDKEVAYDPANPPTRGAEQNDAYFGKDMPETDYDPLRQDGDGKTGPGDSST